MEPEDQQFESLYAEWIIDYPTFDSRDFKTACHRWFLEGICKQIEIENQKLRDRLKKLNND